MRLKWLALLFSLLIFLPVLGCSKSGPPKISIRWPKGLIEGTDAAVFMVILNDGKGGDTLKGCSVMENPDIVCELHDFVDGRMKMVQSIEIPPAETVELKPGGRHIMLIGAGKSGLKKITLALSFAKSGKREVVTELVR